MKYYVTVGKSLWEKSRCWQNLNANFHSLQGDDYWQSDGAVGDYKTRQRLLREIFEGMGHDSKCFLDNVKELVQTYYEPCWDDSNWRRLPAELTTIYKMAEGTVPIIQVTGDKQEGHVFIFVAQKYTNDAESSTKEAYLCAAILKTHAMNAGPGTPLYNAAVKVLDTELALTPKDSNHFYQDICTLINWSNGTCGVPSSLIMTGSYKGLLIGVSLRVAHLLRQIGASEQFPSSMYYLHESADKIMVLDAAAYQREPENLSANEMNLVEIIE